jgi:hypothetical protein
MSTLNDPIPYSPPGWARERPAPSGGEPPRGPDSADKEPPAGPRPDSFLVALLRALSAWCA